MRPALVLALLLAASPAVAQTPSPASPEEQNLLAQWQAAQTGQQNVASAVERLVAALREARADAAKAKAETEAIRKKCGAPCSTEPTADAK